MDGHHIQFNVVSAKTLRDAQKHPENHRDLIVRVAGYSDYFNDLGKNLQNEIIMRTEHGGF
jgi:formate C-acetyltransferase